MTSNSAAFLSVKDLVVEYTAEGQVIHAVNGVSFKLERGKALGLVGETGAGKTSTAKAILRILPDPPARIRGGEIYLDGEDLLKLSEKEMRRIRGRKVSMIFQDPMTALNPIMKVGAQIAEVIKLHNKVTKQEATEKAKQMLELVGIPRDRYDEYPHQFSGGMKQRVVIAMALACSPELLLADEPTTALDVTIQAQVLEMIAKLQKDLETSMIMISHNLGVVAEVCDDLAVIYAGRDHRKRQQRGDLRPSVASVHAGIVRRGAQAGRRRREAVPDRRSAAGPLRPAGRLLLQPSLPHGRAKNAGARGSR